MILDHLSRRDRFRLGPRFDAAFEWLEKTDLACLSEGRIDIDGDRVFALVSDYETRPTAPLEAHRRYADVQFVVIGEERLAWSPLVGLETSQAYLPERDIEFFDLGGAPLPLSEGWFCVLWPEDAHAPGLHPDNGQTRVRKVVVKVLVEGVG